MEGCRDFIQWLGHDMSMKILMCLDDPSDLVRVGSVSRSWRQFVIANGLAKQLCLRIFPETLSVARLVETKDIIEPLDASPDSYMESDCLEREHKIYAFLARGFASFIRKDCISEAIIASSTDNYPEESIQNTLEPRDRVGRKASYWSSEGKSDPAVPETLVYKLISKLSVVTEIHIQPFLAYFQFEFPIYSAKAVRFRMGRPKLPMEMESEASEESAIDYESTDGEFVWTYTSPEFPMAQENCLQKFKLPEPVLCIGGILQVELLGRVQRQEIDGLYYICVSHVQAVGRPLSPPFDIEILDPSGRCALTYCPEEDNYRPAPESPEGATSEASGIHSFTASVRMWEELILNTLLGGGGTIDNDASDDELVA